ncbi:CRP-like cAMP-binding protein [Paucibacter oligotrophus]|uniref:CRP-like cAMP-binding protein n=1 Tax=Roseateles oligotrophus TaxID=1769250 RepID=A0A840LGY4_9BURK|nr:Crp/Fnr family transcriptional regulator [Roseateles oligotrophus]MBB4845872.1 CRP-like cAMP-binding protein [Roseateles oligotrophus]
MQRLPDHPAVETTTLKASPNPPEPKLASRALLRSAESLASRRSLPIADLRVSAEQWAALMGEPGLSPDELQALEALGRCRRVAPGEPVFQKTQAAEHLVAVLDGVVGLGSMAAERQFHLERSVHGPAWLDLSSAWMGAGHGQDAQAMSPAALLELPLSGLRPLLQRFPALNERLLMALAQTVQKLTGATHDLMAKDAQKRLITWLLSRAAAPDGDVALRERKRELAAQLAITPETLSRLLRQLMSAGLIEVRGYSIKLLNPVALRALMQA